jgi:hypothetical protein
LDGRLLTPDQNLTDDIETFTSTLTHLFSHLTKPFFDIAIIGWSLISMVRQRKNARGLKGNSKKDYSCFVHFSNRSI